MNREPRERVMFVEWKKVRLGARNDRKDVECVHSGEGRWTWTPLVMETYAAPSGSRRRTVLRPGPELRSCCMDDPIVRVRWWNAVADVLLAARGTDVDAVVSELAKRVPLPTQDEEITFTMWPHEAPWRERRRIDHAAAHRERLARDVRCEVAAELRPVEKDWRDAVSEWQRADVAYEEKWWGPYVLHERKGIEWVGKAIAKARQRARFTTMGADVAPWLDALHEHVRRLDMRQSQREAEESRRRAEDGRRRQREFDEQRRRAEEARRRTSQSPGVRTPSRSVVDRMHDGFVTDWAALLGLNFPCTRDALKRAHRDSALRHHPDRGGDPEMMKAVNVAKERLEAELTLYWATSA